MSLRLEKMNAIFFAKCFGTGWGCSIHCLVAIWGGQVLGRFFDRANDLFQEKKGNPDKDFKSQEDVLYRDVLGAIPSNYDFLYRISFLTALGLLDVPDAFAKDLAGMDPNRIPCSLIDQGVIVLYNPAAFKYDMQINPAGGKENKKTTGVPVVLPVVLGAPKTRFRAKESVGSCDFTGLLDEIETSSDEAFFVIPDVPLRDASPVFPIQKDDTESYSGDLDEPPFKKHRGEIDG